LLGDRHACPLHQIKFPRRCGIFGGDVVNGARIEVFEKDGVIIDWIINLSIKIKMRTEGKSEKYLKTFKPLNEWLSKGALDDGVATGGQRLRYVCELVEAGKQPIIKNELPISRQVE